METEPTSEHHNAALKLLQFLPFQPKDMAKIHLTQRQQSKKWSVLPRLVVYCPWLTIMLYQILFSCMNFVLNCHESHVRINIAISIWKLCPQTPCCCASPSPLVQSSCAYNVHYTAYMTAATHASTLYMQDSNWVTVANISTAQPQLCVPTKQSRLCIQKT